MTVLVESQEPRAVFQRAVHYTSTHLAALPPIQLRFLTLVARDGDFFLVPTRPLVRRIEHAALITGDPAPNDWTKPDTAWGVLLDAAGGGPSLQLDDRELYVAALAVTLDDFGDDLHSAQTLVKQLQVLIAAKYGVRVTSFAELPGVDPAVLDETVREMQAVKERVRVEPAAVEAMPSSRPRVASPSVSVADDGHDRGAFTDHNPSARPSRR